MKEKKTLNKIKWDYQTTEDDGIKCLEDNVNKVNVFLQQSFGLNTYNAIDDIYKCGLKFFSNSYPIIIIENANDGGSISLAEAFHQLTYSGFERSI